MFRLLRFYCAVLSFIFIAWTPDVTSGIRIHVTCPDNYTQVAGYKRCVSAHENRTVNASIYIADDDEHLILPRAVLQLVLGVSIAVVSMIILVLVRSVIRESISRWRGRGDTFVITRIQALPKYECLDKDALEASKINPTLLLTGTPFYEVDSTQRMIGLRGHIL